MSVVNEEKEQWKDVPYDVYMYGFASKNGFTEDVENDESLLLISLDDTYSPLLESE